ncbi:hypothetical protein IAT38_005699 [Cryptococcus sp. DSM 104549]
MSQTFPNPLRELIDTLPTPISLSDLTHTISTLSDSEFPQFCLELFNSQAIDDSLVARSVIEQGLAGGAVALQDVLGLPEEVTRDEKAVRGVLGERYAVAQAYTLLVRLRERLDTYEVLAPRKAEKPGPEVAQAAEPEEEAKDEEPKGEEEEMELDDPWGDAEEPAEGDKEGNVALLDDPWASTSPIATKTTQPTLVPDLALDDASDEEPATELPVSLASFLTSPPAVSAWELASFAELKAVKVVSERHSTEVYPWRLAVLEAIPGWVPPGEIEAEGLLPRIGEDGSEKWVAPAKVEDAVLSPQLVALLGWLQPPSPPSLAPYSENQPRPQPLTSAELAEWYTSRTLSLDSLGLIDLQLAWVQHGASSGVPSLDSLGEDLSLLSRLVYDANLTPEQHARWNLSSWRTAPESTIVDAYLSSSTPASIVRDIKRLVLPYLYVLESRAERSGKPSPSLLSDALNAAILALPLELALPVFEASKATLPAAERVVKNDLDVARLALACLYGSEERGERVWALMSRVFECLPVWELTGRDAEDEELTATTLESISAFIKPTSATALPPTKQDLFVFFHPLPFASLSRALDILDVHLESGEVLARWGVEKRLRDLLGASRDKGEQKELAERMVRQGGGGEEGWRRLWENMARLSGGEGGDELLKGALGRLDVRERGRIYLGGILRSGNLDTARRMLKRLQAEDAVDDKMVEEVVLETSKEFYMSAESGNIHTGDMKLAYDCLSVAQTTPAIEAEKHYIEATSRLSSFPSLTLTPLEIRHTKDPLSLISTVLSSGSGDTYKHPDLMMELADKLGCGGEVERGLIWGMVGRAAEGHGDWEVGEEAVNGMVGVVRKRERGAKRRSHQTTAATAAGTPADAQREEPDARLRRETYTLAHALAAHPDFPSISTRMVFLSHALELCPPSAIPDILATFREVESGRMKLDGAAKRRRVEGIAAPRLPSDPVAISQAHGQGVGGEERVLGSRTAAKAAKLALDLGGRFSSLKPLNMPSPSLRSGGRIASPFGLPSAGAGSRSASRETQGRESEGGYAVGNDGEDGSGTKELFEGLGGDEAERVRQGARRALVRGVGWLLGADESEITGGER